MLLPLLAGRGIVLFLLTDPCNVYRKAPRFSEPARAGYRVRRRALAV
jgi:hypothetical protein